MKTIWPIAISVSFLVHTGIIFGVQFDRAQKLKENALTNELLSREIEIIAHDTLKDNKLNETGSDIKVPPYISNKSFKKIMTANNTLADIAKPDIMEENIKEIILSEIPNDKRLRENPAYMDYYRMVRGKIKETAYRLYSVGLEGEIIISFVLSANGELVTLFVDQGSKNNDALRTIALKSVEQAAPFASFPDDLLEYPQLQFNISIYFKNRV
ncbi:MAG: hypothetical protein PHZ27_01530 [Candidatus Omnitrophica bacterium]|nr:hypothetical protein [Candidatus Omnitrophota bacterium]MDD5440876.1 hypothetical protein [Candidatus Omnitrophota bacterium]